MKITDVKQTLDCKSLIFYLHSVSGRPLVDCYRTFNYSTDQEKAELFDFVAELAHAEIYQHCTIVKENSRWLYVDLKSMVAVNGLERWIETYEAMPSLLDEIRKINGVLCFRFKKYNHYKMVEK